MMQQPPAGSSKKDPRGSANSDAGPRFLVIGRIVKPHGINGDVAVDSYTDSIDRFTVLEKVFLSEEEVDPLIVESVRFHQGRVLLKFKGINGRNAAESLRNSLLYITIDDAVDLKEGEYFLFQLLGMEVINQDEETIGKIVDILETQANNVFIVKAGDREHLVPDIPQVVKSINFERKLMTIEEPPGLIDH